ncbi:hypothetical protein B0T26DRAFT_633161 [Lasiosphaeria miniovina]|uniref:RGS domain-containing protein n=1 Tax=Lasiosphaeria miniovina TaxID=1954250 RepID=A0AA40BJA9_9PEZI|nr:uncharacterized protein B0T26DRAFT_633161 [Lasiosphaeria miniovina]KAK0735250.1 hypothetical protein B0T26DRAFT_633161 [Lasiosphaeria miniovina]
MILARESAKAATVGSEFGTTPDTKPELRFGVVGIFWDTFAAVWTVVLVGGMVSLWVNRQKPALRRRGLTLTFAGLVLLHLYWTTVQITYTIGPLVPEVAEYWVMGLWYPFGIALFQAGNSQFLHVAKAQSRFARPLSQASQASSWYNENHHPKKSNLAGRVRKMDYSTKMFTFITLGMVVQLFVVVLFYMMSRKFHADFGVPGTEAPGNTPAEISMHQGRGWEWIPSLFWQFLWAWVFAPIILWKSRGIHDTHGWRLQTVVCCIAGLPAAPMWLIALYVPAMAPVNVYFVPPQWICISIFVMEIFTVFVPCWHVWRDSVISKETNENNERWKINRVSVSGRDSSETTPPLSPTSTKIGESSSFDPWKKLSIFEPNQSSEQPDIEKYSDDSILTMKALEHVLHKNPEPLRQFSARRDFSGENIAFLTAVADWKALISQDFRQDGQDGVTPELVRQYFTDALRIYTDFISPRDADFPINIAWPDLRKLEGTFERAARSVLGDGDKRSAADAVSPFAEVAWDSPPVDRAAQQSRGSEDGMLDMEASATVAAHGTHTLALTSSSATVLAAGAKFAVFKGDIPQAIDATVFDAAYGSVKYLVLTNTWPKYVRERRNSESSSGTARTDETYETTGFKKSMRRILSSLKPLIG